VCFLFVNKKAVLFWAAFLFIDAHRKVIYFPIQYLTTPIFSGVTVFGQQIGYKKHIKRVNKE